MKIPYHFIKNDFAMHIRNVRMNSINFALNLLDFNINIYHYLEEIVKWAKQMKMWQTRREIQYYINISSLKFNYSFIKYV